MASEPIYGRSPDEIKDDLALEICETYKVSLDELLDLSHNQLVRRLWAEIEKANKAAEVREYARAIYQEKCYWARKLGLSY